MQRKRQTPGCTTDPMEKMTSPLLVPADAWTWIQTCSVLINLEDRTGGPQPASPTCDKGPELPLGEETTVPGPDTARKSVCQLSIGMYTELEYTVLPMRFTVADDLRLGQSNTGNTANPPKHQDDKNTSLDPSVKLFSLSRGKTNFFQNATLYIFFE